MITTDTFPKALPNPLFDDLPKALKDPENYKKVQKLLIEALATRCSHSDMEGWAKCLECQAAKVNRENVMNKLGFKSMAQYMAWKKVHEIIDRRVKLR
ncbi:MAG: hypothetical protein Q6360_13245 [Candidatus Brocadiales bacterium]|nr:hypothetical protein [Candidatus Brocadiales bacterium]